MNIWKTYALNQSPLYQLRSRKRLAAQIFNIELPLLERLAANESNYRVSHVVQGDKKRQVEAPKPILERLHRRLFMLLTRIEKPDYLHSGVKGRSYLTNAKAHIGRTPLVKLDIKKFYPSVSGACVFRFFRETLQCSPDVAGLITRLCVYDNHVPTGSCVSQLLAFFAAKPLFDQLHAKAQSEGLCFTVYVDDMTFSGCGATPAFLWEAKQVVHSNGFGYHKDRCYEARDRKVVTGVMIDGARLAVQPSKEFEMWRRMRALGDGNPAERRAAIESLLGSVVAAGQIEARLLMRLKGLRALRAAALKIEVAAVSCS